MSWGKFAFLLALILGAAGLSVWVVFLAVRADALGGSVFRALVPLLILASVAMRALRKGREK